MPELPEVETTRAGIAPYIQGKTVRALRVHNASLRWPVPADLALKTEGFTLRAVERRAKYLLLNFDHGCLLVHLGMSGSLRVIVDGSERLKHDHVELEMADGTLLRYCDPRRFGAWLWHDHSAGPLASHALLAELGPEPLSRGFNARYFKQKIARRQQAIKLALMDNHVVVGVGNIYANESLFLSGIRPTRPAASLTDDECELLVAQVKKVLSRSIKQGGTTLRDFVGGDGKPGYFAQKLYVYGREGEACKRCGHPLEGLRLGQRATVYCPICQP